MKIKSLHAQVAVALAQASALAGVAPVDGAECALRQSPAMFFSHVAMSPWRSCMAVGEHC